MGKRLTEQSNKGFFIISGCLIILFAGLSYMFPYSGDDWAWGSSIGLQRLETFFEMYNGRYFGNFLVLAITRSRLLRTILMSLSYYGVCLLCYKYAPIKKNSSLLLAAVLFFVIPRAVFSQSIVWSAGYANYVPSAIISALYMLMVNNITGTDTPEYPQYFVIVTFLMGFCGAPFIENIALFNICFAVAVIGYTAIKFKKAFACHFGFLAGSIAGSLWMFSNSAYSAISAGTDSYRDVSENFLDLILTVLGHILTVCQHLVISNGVMCAIASVLLAISAIIFIKQSKCKKEKFVVISVLSVHFVCLAYIIYRTCLIYITVNEETKTNPSVHILSVAVAFIYIITMFILPLRCVDKGCKFRMLLPLYCVPVIVAPLLVVNPIGPRCLFAAYLFIMIFIVNLFCYTSQKLNPNKTSDKKIVAGLVAGLCTLAVIYISIFYPIFKYDGKRNELAKIQSENGESTVIISQLPHSNYVWMGNPDTDLWTYRYKIFNSLDESVKIKVVSPEEFDEFYQTYITEK